MTDQPGNPNIPPNNSNAPLTPPPDQSPEELAAKLTALLDQFESQVPGFQPHNSAEIRRVSNAARYGKELIPLMITAVTSFAPAAERKIFDVERGRATLQAEEALRPVAHRLSALLDGFAFTLDSNLGGTSTEALHGYAWFKHFAKSPEGVGVRPFLANMKSAVRKIINLRKPAKKPAPPTMPPGAQGLLAPNLGNRNTAPDTIEDDLPEDFRKALEAVSDDDEE
jgi:hypothetical protein